LVLQRLRDVPRANASHYEDDANVPTLVRTSENSVKANFREFPFHALR
jgi:hypothetical protein